MTIPDGLMDMLALLADTSPMHALRTLVSAQAHFDDECDDGSPEANCGRPADARTPLIANFDRHRKGLDLIAPDPSKTVAETSGPSSMAKPLRKPWSVLLTSA